MTLARISKTARAVLRNKALASAISLALSTDEYDAAKNGITVKINGKEYIIDIVRSSGGTEIKLIAKE